MPPAQAMLQASAPAGAQTGPQMASSMPPVQRGGQTPSAADGQLRAQLVSSLSPSQMGAQTTSSAHALMGAQTGSSRPHAQMVPPVATPAGAGMPTQGASSRLPAQMVPQVAVPAPVQIGSQAASSMPPLPMGPQVAPPASARTGAQLASCMSQAPVLRRHPKADPFLQSPVLQSRTVTALESSLPNLDSSIVEVDHKSVLNVLSRAWQEVCAVCGCSGLLLNLVCGCSPQISPAASGSSLYRWNIENCELWPQQVKCTICYAAWQQIQCSPIMWPVVWLFLHVLPGWYALPAIPLNAAQLLVLGVSLTPFRILSAELTAVQGSMQSRWRRPCAAAQPPDAPPSGLHRAAGSPATQPGRWAAHQRPPCHTAPCALQGSCCRNKQLAGPGTCCRYEWASLQCCSAATTPDITLPGGSCTFKQKGLQALPAAFSGSGCHVTQTAMHAGSISGAVLWPAAELSLWLGLSGCPACRRQVLQAGSRGGPRRPHTDLQI